MSDRSMETLSVAERMAYSDDRLAGLLERAAEALEYLAGRVKIEPSDAYRLGTLVGELRAYATGRVENPVDAVIDVALGEIGNYRDEWFVAGAPGSAAGSAEVWSTRSERCLHVVGASAVADRLRERLRSNEAAGWSLRPVPPGATPIRVLYEALGARSVATRARGVLVRTSFATVEEVAATPDEALLSSTNFGRGSLEAVRRAIEIVEGRVSDGH
ncbi:MAG: DNA-directed RNA polymerase subunit alpha C-terminal domain-containing protein [Acidimicrobiales bacterium]